MNDPIVYRFTPDRVGEGHKVEIVADEPWSARARYAQFQSVDLGDGVHGVILDPCRAADPMAYVVEIFLAEGSCGDGEIDMTEVEDGGLAPVDPDALAAIRRQEPNLLSLYRDGS